MKKLISFLLILMFLFTVACGTTSTTIKVPKIDKSYAKVMKQADDLAKILAKHSAFSICFWKAALGEDINKLSHSSIVCLNTIEQIMMDKDYKSLNDCEKGIILACWLKFSAELTNQMITKLPAEISRIILLFK